MDLRAPSLLQPKRRLRTETAAALAREHFNRTLPLTEVAEACHLSRFEFCRAFRREHGVTFGAYLLRERMRHAALLLGRGDLPVKQVAYAVGFDDASYFVRQFRRVHGTTPTGFARRCDARSA